MICPYLTTPFAGNKIVKTVCNKVQVPPLLRQGHNAALGLLCRS